MNRGSFIKYASFGSAALLAMPLWSINRFQKSITIHLIEPSMQIRHGLKVPLRKRFSNLHWLKNIEKSIFFANGFSESENDLVTYDLHSDNDELHLNVIDQLVSINDGHGFTEINISERQGLIFESERFTVDLVQAEGESCKIKLRKGAVLISLLPNVSRIDSLIIGQNHYGIAETGKEFKLENQNKENHLIIINYKNA